MILITHHDDCRQTIQLVHASAKIAGETVAQYRARLLPIAQDHASRIVDYPEYMDWSRWIADGIAYDSASDDIYTITEERFTLTCDADPSCRVISDEQAVERKARWDAKGEQLRAMAKVRRVLRGRTKVAGDTHVPPNCPLESVADLTVPAMMYCHPSEVDDLVRRGICLPIDGDRQ